MNMKRIIGAAVLAVGVVLLVFAYQASTTPVEQISDALTGRYTDNTMWYVVSGVAAVVVGALLALSAKRPA